MLQFPAEGEFIRPWIVCEAADRWITAVRRFAPQMMPQPLIPAILNARSAKAREILTGHGPAVILWEVRPDSLAATCDCLARTAIDSPKLLQLVAGSGLADLDQIALSEMGSAASISHPEDLPRLRRMIQGYFATPRGNLD